MTMNFSEVFKIKKHEIICVTGGGGKTSLIFKLAEELKIKGRVLITSTTKIYFPQSDQYENLILENEVFRGSRKGVDILGKGIDKENKKMLGVESETLEKYLEKYDYILVESDGSRSKPVKFWNEDDPKIPSYATMIIGVTNINAVGEKIESVVHRYAHYCERENFTKDQLFTPEKMEKYILKGDFFKSPISFSFDKKIKKYIYINGVEEVSTFETAYKIANSLSSNFLEFKIVLGSVVKNEVYSFKKISGIILAGGFSKRMGKDKLFLNWKNRTFLEEVTDKIDSINFFEKLLVIPKEKFLKLKKKLDLEKKINFKIVFNEESEKGQSESVKLGVKKSLESDGYMFFPVDQPFLKKETIYTIIKEFLKTDLITAPLVEGNRFSPVIFPKRYKEKLLDLKGDTGGREIIKKEKINEVNFLDEMEFKDIDLPEDMELLK